VAHFGDVARRVIKYVIQPPPEQSTFTPFSKVPPEIRVEIWSSALRRERFITLGLERLDANSPTVDILPNKPNPADRSARHNAIVYGHKLHSKLLRVNRESRAEALMFYRILIPCQFWNGTKTLEGKLYFNPEWDMLYIRAESPMLDTLVDFLYRLKTFHDPKHIGLLNLALCTQPLPNQHPPAQPPGRPELFDITPAELMSERGAAFLATVTQLHEVFFVHSVYNGPYMDTSSSTPDPANIHVNRSLPLMARTPYFERISRDPRPIGQDLRSLHVQNISLFVQSLGEWIDMLEPVPQPPAAGDHRTPEYRLVLHFHVYEGPANREAAPRYLEQRRYLEQEERFRTVDRVVAIRPDGEMAVTIPQVDEGAYDPAQVLHSGGGSAGNTMEDLQPMAKRAFGFWIFPLTALGFKEEARLPSKGDVASVFAAHADVDWSTHRPALALANLY
jgi:hypothetical protein